VLVRVRLLPLVRLEYLPLLPCFPFIPPRACVRIIAPLYTQHNTQALYDHDHIIAAPHPPRATALPEERVRQGSTLLWLLGPVACKKHASMALSV
jgi:hypothetical protein